MSINSCCLWFVFCLVKIIGKVNTFTHVYLMITVSVYNESVICHCNIAEILRPQHFVIVCEHDDILSTVTPIKLIRSDRK